MARTVLEAPRPCKRPFGERPDRHRRPDGERQIGAGAAARRGGRRRGHQCGQHAAVSRSAHHYGAARARRMKRGRRIGCSASWMPTSRHRWAAGCSSQHRRSPRRAAAQRPAIVVGGTGLYLHALLHGLAPVPDVPEPIRTAARLRLAERGLPALRAELAELDPVMAARLRPTDRQRLLRAYEVIVATGRSLAAWQEMPPVRIELPAAALRSCPDAAACGALPTDRTAPAGHGGEWRHRGAQSAAPAGAAGGSASDEGRRGTRAAGVRIWRRRSRNRARSGRSSRPVAMPSDRSPGCATSCPSCGRSRHSARASRCLATGRVRLTEPYSAH